MSKGRDHKKKRADAGLIEAASARWNWWHGVPSPFSYIDGTLVHAAVTALLHLETVGLRSSGHRRVWATSCGTVLGVGKMPFSWSKKMVTCIECIGMSLKRANRNKGLVMLWGQSNGY